MTIWTPSQVITIWRRNGGAATAEKIAAAVSMAESGGNDHAHSPSADWGLWQINEIHFPELGWTSADAVDPNKNARAAIRISGNGSNWAAWCTCWVNPGPNCGHGYLPTPQRGSPAGNQLTALGGLVGSVLGNSLPPSQTPHTDAASHAWGTVGSFVGSWGRSRVGGYADIAAMARGLIR